MSYLALLRTPHVVRLLVAALIGRTPAAAAALAISLAMRDAGHSYTQVGLVVGVFGVGMAAGGPILGRIVDRNGQFAVLTRSSFVSGAGLALIALGSAGTAVPVLGAAVAGLATPPLEACLRGLWPHLVAEEEMDQALGFDAATQEIIFVVGPLLVTGAAAVADPLLALWLLAVLGMAGTLVFALTPPSRCWVPLGGSRHWLGPLQSNGLLGLLAALLFSGGSIGALNLFVVSYAERYQIPGGAGLCLALNAVGALIGALAYGSVSWRMSLRSRLGLTTVSMAVAYWCLTLTPEPSWMAGLMVMTGIFLAPTLAVGFSLVTQVSPQGSVTEAFAWLVTTFTVGSALGSLCAGAVISGGLGRAATVAAVAATCSAAVACGGRALWPERTEPGFVGSVGA